MPRCRGTVWDACRTVDDALVTITGVYQWLVRTDRSGQPESRQDRTARAGLRQVAAEALQTTGDQVVNAKTALPWLFASLGVPSSLIALLVPVRESGSMLPQAAMAPWVERARARRWLWVAGATGQAVGTASMALVAATTGGGTAGVLILLALSLFSVSRALSSLSGKDVLGRTVPKGERGQITGLTTVLSGAAAVTLGLAIRVFGGDDVSPVVLAVLLGAAALAWVVGAVVYAGIEEPAEESPPATEPTDWPRRAWALLCEDVPFRRFVLARALLLVSALSPPFVVALAAGAGGVGLGALGPFVVAQGLAGLLGGQVSGRLADRSSRTLMAWGSAAASSVVVGFLLVLAVPGARELWVLYPVVYLLLALTHTAVRVARKTYVVDLAESDARTEYVAVANTAMGALLLATGAVSGGLALLGEEVALLFLAGLGSLGVLVSRSLPEVSRRG
jgi:hypothetical protein